MDSVRNFGEITIYTYTVGLLKMNHEVTVGLLKMNREVKQIVRRFLSRSRFY